MKGFSMSIYPEAILNLSFETLTLISKQSKKIPAGACDRSFRTPGHALRVVLSTDREDRARLVSSQPCTYHCRARVEEVLCGLEGQRRPDLVADAVNLGDDDRGPHSHGVCGR
jgi:hypothetical protein